MTISSLRERTIPTNGVRLRVLEDPDHGKPPLLLLHGILGRAETWDAVASYLAPHYRLIAPDLRGHHLSDKPASGYSLRDYAADLIGVLDALNIKRAPVVGHSLGALVAVVLAVESPERAPLVVLEDPPTQRDENVRLWLQALLDARRLPVDESIYILALVYPRAPEPDLLRYAEALRATAEGPFLELLNGSATVVDHLSHALALLDCPVLLTCGNPARGSALTEAAVEESMRSLRHGSLLTFPDAGHSIHSDQPAAFARAVLDFLSEREF